MPGRRRETAAAVCAASREPTASASPASASTSAAARSTSVQPKLCNEESSPDENEQRGNAFHDLTWICSCVGCLVEHAASSAADDQHFVDVREQFAPRGPLDRLPRE